MSGSPGKPSVKDSAKGVTMEFVNVPFTSYTSAIDTALDSIKAFDRIKAQTAILLKPNVINSSPHPITTSVDCCEALVQYIKKHSTATIVIAEGCGDPHLETTEAFERLGYTALAEKYDIPLIDLNHAPLCSRKNDSCKIFREIHLPEIAFNHYIISIPVLKAHSLAQITGTLKNMMGFVPPQHYSGNSGSWKKAVFHHKMQQSIIDLNTYLIPDLSIMDCSIGMAEYHLGGPRCSPPVGRIIAGYNPWEVDRMACDLLGLDWRTIKHVAVDYDRDKNRAVNGGEAVFTPPTTLTLS
jgi:uncharacterized protein (DUF362 family)